MHARCARNESGVFSPYDNPDVDALVFKWWQYPDAGTAQSAVTIAHADSREGSGFVVPDEPGQILPIVLEVADDDIPSLTRYQRVSVSIAR